MFYQFLAKTSAAKTFAALGLTAVLIVSSLAPIALAQEVGTGTGSTEVPSIEADSSSSESEASEVTDGTDGANTPDGESGQDASERSREENQEGDGGEVTTGDASTGADVENAVNTNETNTDGSEDSSGTPEGEESTRDEVPRTRTETEETVINNNDAEVENNLDVQSDTGDNTVNGEDGQITTGDAEAFANIINVVNTNIYNSEGLFLFLNNFFNLNADLDLRGEDWFTPAGTGAAGGSNCGIYNCQAVTHTTLQNNNNVSITNSVVVRSSTGGNTAGDGGSINTGDAYAAANVVNVANTNIVDSNYLLVAFNNFGNWAGDIVFPVGTFFNDILGSDHSSAACNSGSNVEVTNNNNAVVENAVSVEADTGNNDANADSQVAEEEDGASDGENGESNAESGESGEVASTDTENTNTEEGIDGTGGQEGADGTDGESAENGTDTGEDGGSIDTGDATSDVAVTNVVNSNIFCDTSFSILFRIHGNWSGNVFNAPEGVFWVETDDGVQVFGEGLEEEIPVEDGTETESARSRTRPGPNGPTTVDIENNNNAEIRNDVRVIALTGDNKVGSEGSISTGNAQAAANIFNLANTNIVGKNWLIAVINIFGDWDGNVSFGRPDLWVGVNAEVPHNPALPGDTVTYTFTVMNNGDAGATGVKLRDTFDSSAASVVGGSFDESATGTVVWNLDHLNPGASTEVSYSLQINPDIPYGETNLTNIATVSAEESDEDTTDNEETVTLLAFHEAPQDSSGGGGGSSSGGGGGGGGIGIAGTAYPRLELTKTNNTDGSISAGNSVDYTLVVENNGRHSAYNAQLIDTLTDESGEVIHEEAWDLGEVFTSEEIKVTYTTEFSEALEPGLYTNSAQVFAENGNSPIAISEVEITEPVIEIDPEELVDDIVSNLGVENLGTFSGGAAVGNSDASNDKFADTEDSNAPLADITSTENSFFASMFGLLGDNLLYIAIITIGLFLILLVARRRRDSESK